MPHTVAASVKRIGEDRNVTISLERGGYDAKLFTWLDEHGIGFVTNERGDPGLPTAALVRRATRFKTRRRRMHVAEDDVMIGGAAGVPAGGATHP